ncbi:MAG: type II secretion system F family protein [Saccharofermentanales bacterium]
MIMIQKFFGNEEKMRKQQIELISMLNQWYQVKEDLLFAFEKCTQSGIGEPTRTYIQDFTVRIKGGLGLERALELLGESYADSAFRYFIKQISFNLKYRGNTGELLDNLETQFIKIDEEHTRRKIESSKDRLYLKGMFIFTPIIASGMIMFNPPARELFIDTPLGNIAAILSIVLYGTGILLFMTAHKSSL